MTGGQRCGSKHRRGSSARGNGFAVVSQDTRRAATSCTGSSDAGHLQELGRAGELLASIRCRGLRAAGSEQVLHDLEAESADGRAVPLCQAQTVLDEVNGTTA